MTDKKKTPLLNLFLAFFKIGIMTFGGGYAMLPMLERECIEKQHWLTEDEVLDYFAIGQMTPGIIAVNTATFVGYKERRIIGAVFSTLGMIAPSIIIITLLATVLNAFEGNPYLVKAFSGIRIVVCALLLQATVKMAKKSIKTTSSIILAVLALAAELALKVSPIIITITAIAYSIAIFFAKQKGEGR